MHQNHEQLVTSRHKDVEKNLLCLYVISGKNR